MNINAHSSCVSFKGIDHHGNKTSARVDELMLDRLNVALNNYHTRCKTFKDHPDTIELKNGKDKLICRALLGREAKEPILSVDGVWMSTIPDDRKIDPALADKLERLTNKVIELIDSIDRFKKAYMPEEKPAQTEPKSGGLINLFKKL